MKTGEVGPVYFNFKIKVVMCSRIGWNCNIKKPPLRDFTPSFIIKVLINEAKGTKQTRVLLEKLSASQSRNSRFLWTPNV
jgi:hypothetical protein